MTEYRLTFPHGINIDTANTLRTGIIEVMHQDDFGSLTILFSSSGGSTEQSISLYNFIRQIRTPIHMHAVGHVGSSAFPIFLAADKRTSAEHARFFLHEYTWTFTEKTTLHGLEGAVKRLQNDIDLAKSIIRSRTSIPADRVAAIGGDASPSVITPNEAKGTQSRRRSSRTYRARASHSCDVLNSSLRRHRQPLGFSEPARPRCSIAHVLLYIMSDSPPHGSLIRYIPGHRPSGTTPAARLGFLSATSVPELVGRVDG